MGSGASTQWQLLQESIKESIENIRELERARAKEQEQTAIDFGKDLDNAKDEPVTAKIEESEAPIATNAKK